MSDTLEVTRLEDLVDLEEVPPCEVFYLGIRPCGNPSVARVKFNCPCSPPRYTFYCQRCLIDLRNGWMRCQLCGDIVFNGNIKWGIS